MKVLIDTNIILDVLCNCRDFLEDSANVFKLCEVRKLSLIFSITDLRADDLKKAADMGCKDYEDAVQSACASRIKADYIITRNTKDFTGSKVAAIKPSELYERLSENRV